MMEIRAAKVIVIRKDFVRALNRRMTVYKWLFFIALAAVPLGFWMGDNSQALAMIGAVFLLSLINLLSGITNVFTFSRKNAAFLFEERTYLMNDNMITIEYSDQSKIEFSRANKLTIKKKSKYFTIADKTQFEIIPKSVFISDEQKDAFISAYLQKK